MVPFAAFMSVQIDATVHHLCEFGMLRNLADTRSSRRISRSSIYEMHCKIWWRYCCASWSRGVHRHWRCESSGSDVITFCSSLSTYLVIQSVWIQMCPADTSHRNFWPCGPYYSEYWYWSIFSSSFGYCIRYTPCKLGDLEEVIHTLAAYRFYPPLIQCAIRVAISCCYAATWASTIWRLKIVLFQSWEVQFESSWMY